MLDWIQMAFLRKILATSADVFEGTSFFESWGVLSGWTTMLPALSDLPVRMSVLSPVDMTILILSSLQSLIQNSSIQNYCCKWSVIQLPSLEGKTSTLPSYIMLDRSVIKPINSCWHLSGSFEKWKSVTQIEYIKNNIKCFTV